MRIIGALLFVSGPAVAAEPDAPATAGRDASDEQEDVPDSEPADPPDLPASDRVILLTPPELLPSALDDIAGAHAEADDAELGQLLGMVRDLAAERLSLPIRSTFFVRPRLSGVLALPEDGLRGGVGLGIAVGQRWWPLADTKVRWSGENRLEYDGIVGGARGWRAGLTAHVGPWFGPVGLRIGARLDAGRLRAGAATLVPAALVGPEALIAFKVGSLHPWLGFSPQWAVGGKREPASGPTVGDETVWTGGIAIETPLIWPRFEANVRTTAVGPVTTLGFGLQVRPRFKPKSPPEPTEEDP